MTFTLGTERGTRQPVVRASARPGSLRSRMCVWEPRVPGRQITHLPVHTTRGYDATWDQSHNHPIALHSQSGPFILRAELRHRRLATRGHQRARKAQEAMGLPGSPGGAGALSSGGGAQGCRSTWEFCGWSSQGPGPKAEQDTVLPGGFGRVKQRGLRTEDTRGTP